jgi:hypothetical protein
MSLRATLKRVTQEAQDVKLLRVLWQCFKNQASQYLNLTGIYATLQILPCHTAKLDQNHLLASFMLAKWLSVGGRP